MDVQACVGYRWAWPVHRVEPGMSQVRGGAGREGDDGEPEVLWRDPVQDHRGGQGEIPDPRTAIDNIYFFIFFLIHVYIL